MLEPLWQLALVTHVWGATALLFVLVYSRKIFRSTSDLTFAGQV